MWGEQTVIEKAWTITTSTFFCLKNLIMKRIIPLILIIWTLIPALSFAEKWDVEINFNPTTCQVVRYTCDKNENEEKRYGWSYYSDERGCGCTQLLSNTEISTIQSKSNSLIVAIDVVFPEPEQRTKLLKRIKIHLKKNYSGNERNSLLSDIILSKLTEAYWEF